jgi:hypothetical protein
MHVVGTTTADSTSTTTKGVDKITVDLTVSTTQDVDTTNVDLTSTTGCGSG